MLHVTKATHLGDHRVHIWFNDSTDGEADVSEMLAGPIFEPLQAIEYFAHRTHAGLARRG